MILLVIMAVDLGEVRTGIAYSDAGQSFAFPKTVITERNRTVLLQKIADIAAEIKPGRIVVGLPRNMDGSLGFKAQECTAFSNDLAALSGIDCVLWDERCTTVIAHKALNVTNTRGKKRKATVDAVAATFILESYLQYLSGQNSR